MPSLKYPPEHARPLGYFYFGALLRTAGLNYQPWVAVLQCIAALNVVLLWFLLREFAFDPLPAAAACLFFAFHRALFDAWWKPMYVYDVLCTTFVLLSLLAYAHGRWVLSFVAFWLAVRTKEIGLFVPVILACYEFTLGERKWKRLLVFFAPALIYGGFGLAYNLRLGSGHSYSLHAGPGTLWKSLVFYLSKVFWFPYAGFALLLAPLAVRDRRLYFGLAAMFCGLSIYLLLPGRVAEIYLYLPIAGGAVAIAALSSRRPAIAAATLLLWIPWQYALIRNNAAATLLAAEDRRSFISALRNVPSAALYVYGTAPASLHSWGVEGGLRLFHEGIESVQAANGSSSSAAAHGIRLDWDAKAKRLDATPLQPPTAGK